MDKIISLAKRRGFIFPDSEIYGGLAGFWDWGPFGVLLKENLKRSWWQKFVASREDIFPVETAIIMNPKVWEASGHVAGFSDPTAGGGRHNTMFRVSVGVDQEALTAYLRPETAQGMFVNFKNIIDTLHPKLPFGLAQIGKAFRNEIAPRDFLFRTREFEQMEIEYFVREADWEKYFDYWRGQMRDWLAEIGLVMAWLFEKEVPAEERAHYSKRTVDFEFKFPFGQKELLGLAYRGDFDLKNHGLDYYDEETRKRFIPHVIEPTFGVDRLVLALLLSVYAEDDLGGEKRVFLKLSPALAPIKAAVFPLLRNKPALVQKAHTVYLNLKEKISPIVFDDNASIGKRYRRQDELGTPWCITIDFQTLEDDTVTVRYRDTGAQTRIKIPSLADYLKSNEIK